MSRRNTANTLAVISVVLLIAGGVGGYMTWRVVNNTAVAIDQLSASESEPEGDEMTEAPPEKRVKRRRRKRGKRRERLAEDASPKDMPRVGRVPSAVLGARKLEAPILGGGSRVEDVLRSPALLPRQEVTVPTVATELSEGVAPVDTGTPE